MLILSMFVSIIVRLGGRRTCLGHNNIERTPVQLKGVVKKLYIDIETLTDNKMPN